jgi:regulator of nonsense transcripts 1
LKKTLLSSDRLRSTASELQKHEVQVEKRGEKIFVVSQQYNTRVRWSDYVSLGFLHPAHHKRPDSHQDFELTFENETVNAKIKKVKGKSTELKLTTSINLKAAGELKMAATLGKEEATSLDNQRSNFILFALQGKIRISDNPLLRQIWLPDAQQVRQPQGPPVLKGKEFKRLNNSQMEAVEDMLKEGPEARIVLVHGPPGEPELRKVL